MTGICELCGDSKEVRRLTDKEAAIYIDVCEDCSPSQHIYQQDNPETKSEH